jgi:CRP-like cAMP-binding protein
MGFPKVTFRVCETRHCPIFKYGDTFTVSGIAVLMDNDGDSSFINTTVIQSNQQRDNCKILNGDLTKIIIEYERADQIPDCLVTCSGCTGSIRLEHAKELTLEEDIVTETNKDLAGIIQMLSNFPFFRNIDPKNLNDIINFSTLQRFAKDDIIIRKGDPGSNFYIVVSGKVDVLNETGITISSLTQGEVFGEMSLICEDNVGATVQACEDTEVLNIDHKHFKKILDKYPNLQVYFTRLLAQRLSRSNQIRSDDYASGMIGKLDEIPPEALFQTLNVNNKTGILTITQLSKGTARFSMRQGALIKGTYDGKKGEDAFYEVLREKDGRFKFTPGLPPEDFDVPEIGYFMKLLMEGMQRIDERPTPEIN